MNPLPFLFHLLFYNVKIKATHNVPPHAPIRAKALQPQEAAQRREVIFRMANRSSLVLLRVCPMVACLPAVCKLLM